MRFDIVSQSCRYLCIYKFIIIIENDKKKSFPVLKLLVVYTFVIFITFMCISFFPVLSAKFIV